MKVCVIGLGKIGFSTAEYVKNRGFEVFGYDIDPKAVKFAKSKGIKAFEEWDKIPSDIGVFIICIYVGFGKDTLVRPDLSSLKDLCQKIMRKNKECLISIESTLPVGTCRKMYKEVLSSKTFLIHVPHRWYEKEQEEHGVNQIRVFGAINAESRKRGLEFYEKRLSIPMHQVSSIELAEFSKIVEQAFRYVQIAFAEEVKLVCDGKDMSFKELRDAVSGLGGAERMGWSSRPEGPFLASSEMISRMDARISSMVGSGAWSVRFIAPHLERSRAKTLYARRETCKSRSPRTTRISHEVRLVR